MHAKIGADHALRKLFGGTVEQVFMAELGVCNPRLTDYLGELLSDFVHVDQIFRLHSVDGATISEVSRMEADAVLGAETDPARRKQVINRYIGDFTLFWTGVYPEHLHLRKRAPNRLREFLLQGKRSYTIASELSPPDGVPAPELLRQLSEEFESCVHGLHLVRESWAHSQRLPFSN